MAKVEFCPYCGYVYGDRSQPLTKLMEVNDGKCRLCNNEYMPIEANHEVDYYMKIASSKFPAKEKHRGNWGSGRWREIVEDEAKENPLFNQSLYQKRIENELIRCGEKRKELPKLNFLYCPHCGSAAFNEKENETMICSACSYIGVPYKPIHDESYYKQKAAEKNCSVFKIVIIEEVSKLPDFDMKTFQSVRQEVNRQNQAAQAIWKSEAAERERKAVEANTPKCPTCGSSKIKTISIARKAAGAWAFGILSKTARSQFQCQNCGYKW